MHSRPINSIYRRFVEELMVEMHLLSVNVDFRYDPIYALGVVTSYDRFMQGYRPEKDLTSIFNAICQAVQENPQKYRQDAQKLEEFAKSLSSETLLAWLSKEGSSADVGEFQEVLDAIATNPKFKYSRIFAIGLFTLLEIVGPEMVKDEKQRTAALEKLSAALNLPGEKITKDLELYSSNLDKMNQARQVLQDILAADRKKREDREKEKSTMTNSPSGTEESTTD
jgi:photosystem II biogenesis protein Psp29